MKQSNVKNKNSKNIILLDVHLALQCHNYQCFQFHNMLFSLHCLVHCVPESFILNFNLVQAACVRCHGTKCPLLTAFFLIIQNCIMCSRISFLNVKQIRCLIHRYTGDRSTRLITHNQASHSPFQHHTHSCMNSSSLVILTMYYIFLMSPAAATTSLQPVQTCKNVRPTFKTGIHAAPLVYQSVVENQPHLS